MQLRECAHKHTARLQNMKKKQAETHREKRETEKVHLVYQAI